VHLRVLIALAALASAGCATSNTANTSSKPDAKADKADDKLLGSQATDFTLRDSEGKPVHLSDYLNQKVILIDFWATWCVPCQAELPLLEELYQSRKDKGFVVLSISMDGPETVAQVQTFIRNYNLTYPVLLDTETQVTSIYNQKRTAPLSLLIDKKSRIVKVRQGFNAGDEKAIQAEVDEALAH